MVHYFVRISGERWSKMKQEVRVWVDGSFSMVDGHPIYGGGAVAYIGDSKSPIIFKSAGDDTNWARMRNVAGELLAVMGIVEQLTRFKESLERVVIFYDYDGIEKWATGEWRCKKLCTQAYKQFIDEKMQELNISFIHVKAHAGNVNNEKADATGKEGVKEYARRLQSTDIS